MILPNEKLTTYVKNELSNLRTLNDLAGQRIAFSKTEPEQAEAFIESAALHLQSFYTVVEPMLKRIAENIDEFVPNGNAWHIDLPRQMTYEVPGIRPAVLRRETYDKLDELRGFRHRVRNLYTFQLNPERVSLLVNELPDTFHELSKDMDAFIDFLKMTR